MTKGRENADTRPLKGGVLLTRPLPDSLALAEKLQASGCDVFIEPLLAIRERSEESVDLSGVQGILITSANGIRAFAKQSRQRDVPVYAVGDASAAVACSLEFKTVLSAKGNVEDLAALVQKKVQRTQGALLHVAGSHQAGDLSALLSPRGYIYRRLVLYEAKPVHSFARATHHRIKAGKIGAVFLYSPRTADIFRALMEAEGLLASAAHMMAFCLSKNVMTKIKKLPWQEVIVSSKPDQDVLVQAFMAHIKGQAEKEAGTFQKIKTR